MYREEIKDLKQAKREALLLFYKDYINLYIKLLIGYPNLPQKRYLLKCLLRQYLKFDNNETEVLNLINQRQGNKENIDLLDNLFIEFDEIFEDYYEYLTKCLYVYESTFDNDLIDVIVNRINGNYLKIDENDYRLSLPKVGKTFNNEYKEKVLDKIRSI